MFYQKDGAWQQTLGTRGNQPDIAASIIAAEDALARLDERLATSAIADGWRARSDVGDSCASVWVDGDLVSVEDLVLHDAAADVRAPSPELTRSHAVLRARRRIWAAPPGWALSMAGLDALRGRPADPFQNPEQGRAPVARGDRDAVQEEEDAFSAELAAIDALLARTGRVLAESAATAPTTPLRDRPLCDGDWDEAARLEAWAAIREQTGAFPPVWAAAVALDAWDDLNPLQHTGWLGRLLVGDLLRHRNKTRTHLTAFNTGLKGVARDRHQRDRGRRLGAFLAAMIEAADTGLRDHDRWLNVRRQLERKLTGRRSTSRLPALLDLVMRSPVVSATLIARELGVTKRAAQTLVGELGLREYTGRGRYRAWGVL